MASTITYANARTTNHEILSPLELARTFGVTRKFVLKNISTHFHLESRIINTLSEYSLVTCSGQWLKANNFDGTIKSNYHLVFHNCTPEQAYKSPKLLLSYRTCLPELGITSCYCIVRLPKLSTRISV